MHREDENARLGIEFADVLDRVDAAAARHRDVHDDDVRPQVLVGLIGGRSVAGFADDLQAIMLLEQRAITLPHDGVVIDQ